jgi:hypothetical protein
VRKQTKCESAFGALHPKLFRLLLHVELELRGIREVTLKIFGREFLDPLHHFFLKFLRFGREREWTSVKRGAQAFDERIKLRLRPAELGESRVTRVARTQRK